MLNRRTFIESSALALLAGAAGHAADSPPTVPAAAPSHGDAADSRATWCALAVRLADPVLSALAARRLKLDMPVETVSGAKDRDTCSHLEAFGRLLAGLAPWLELPADDTPEGRERTRLASLARLALDAATDPASPDFLNFTRGAQPLVDAAFLAQALLRAPEALWRSLAPRVQANVVAALQSTRRIKPFESNWLLFATTIEVFLHRAGAGRDDTRLLDGIHKHATWYVGDGTYGDGPAFHWDYYNAFVIQPMLVEALDVVGDETPELTAFRAQAGKRLTRYAAVQERMIAPDGSFPPLGRSIAYRGGAFQGLALAALRRQLPAEVSPAQARVALAAVIRRTLGARGTFDEKGWLRIGLAGPQPGLGERYISTGSLYLCSVALLPLGLPSTDLFWTAPAEKTTWEKIWSGENLPADHSLADGH
jgi:hypothetical protein